MADVTYIKLFVDYLDAIEPLGDAERGRLFTSLLEYARSGEAPQLNGNERFLFPMMRAQIDRDKLFAQERNKRGCKGELHPNWKGGVTPKNQRERHSAAYAIWRKAVFLRDMFTCQMCGQHGGELNAHHIKPWAIYIENRFDVSNGITLCRACHKKLHRR